MSRKLAACLAALALCVTAAGPVIAKNPTPPGGGGGQGVGHMKPMTNAQRKAAAVRVMKAQQAAGVTVTANTAMAAPLSTPDYFGNIPNYANSPIPASVSISGDGVGAFATATIDPGTGAVTGFTMVNQGSGYTIATAQMVGGGGTGAVLAPSITSGAITGIAITNPGSGYNSTPGIRKFVDSLPGLCDPAGNAAPVCSTAPGSKFIPLGVPDTAQDPNWKGPAADYYEIAVIQYTEKLHTDLPATTLRGYVQIETPANSSVSQHVALTAGNGTTVFAVEPPQYLGPVIVAQKDRPVRVKFDNYLPTGTGGDLFLPVDTTVMGAGMGPDGVNSYSENRATLHLHGGVTPWISDGTPDQWTTPAGATEQYPKGVSVRNVPDMPDPGDGSMTFYYTNQQSARLMFYHDHAYGITRLNVYAGEAAGYLVQDQVEAALVNGGTVPGTNTTFAAGTIPADQIPLVIEDKTFVPSASQLAAEDPTWDTTAYGGYGNLWLPHVYMPNQNPGDISGANAMGRWDYGAWFWPPFTAVNADVTNPYACGGTLAGPNCATENATIPGTPNPSIVPEAFMDTMTVNGTPYPFLQLQPKVYRLRILNASNDRYLNLQLYYAAGTGPVWNPDGTLNNNGLAGEVPMVPAVNGGPGTTGYVYPDELDGRQGGVPDSSKAGPSFIQIGTEGGFLPQATVLKNSPVGFNYNRRDIVVLNVSSKTLFLGPAERADVIVDLTSVPAGSNLILYNDAPAPVPAFDTRYDYYTGDPDQVMNGGAPTTLPGYGPNTRTVMQIQVGTNPADPAFNLAALQNATTGLPAAYALSQAAPVVPEKGYDAAFGTTSPADPYIRIQNMQTTFNTGTVSGLTLNAGGSGFTSAPSVSITGGGGAGATASAAIGSPVASLTLNTPGSGYTSAPAVAFSGGGGSGAVATASLTPVPVAGLALISGGSGYTSAPAVTLTGGGGSGANATATLATRSVASVSVTPPGGSGYTSAPTVTLSGGGGSGATATAALTPAKVVKSVTVTKGGRNYTSAPLVVFTGGGATTAASATAVVSGGAVTAVNVTGGGLGYTSAPTVSFTGGGGTGAAATATLAGSVASVTVTKAGAGYTSAPTVAFLGGGGTGAVATATLTTAAVASLTLTPPGGSGYTSAPSVTFSGGGGTGAVATARLVPTTVASLALTAFGSYTSAPTVTVSGGGGTGATATATLGPAQVTSLTLTNPGSGFVSAPTVAISGGGGTGATATATVAIAPVTLALQPKGIQELFDPFYGRMNATMSVEIPNTNGTNQTTIPYGYIDPPTELINTNASNALSGLTPLAMLPDGTQIWKFTHNGVDTHAIHWHMFNVQVINRVGWDGAIRPPDANELGWKDTVRMNPLEDALIAVKPIVPTLPWSLPNSIRPLDVTTPLGTSGVQYTNVQPNGNPVTVVNHLVNLGWEYVFHCHLLGHEENDMMRPVLIGVAPVASQIGTASAASGKVTVRWTDLSSNETGFTVQRQLASGGTWTTVGTVSRPAPTLNANGSVNDFGLSTGTTLSFVDTTVTKKTSYVYRVVANDLIGDTATAGFPSLSVDSVPSAVSNSVTP